MTPSDQTGLRFFFRHAVAAVVIVASSLAVAASAQAQNLTPEQEALHQQLRDLKDRLGSALNSGNIDAALAETDPAISFTAMNNEVAHGQDGVKQYFAKMTGGDDPIVKAMTVSFEPDQLATIYGDDNAVATGSSMAHFKLKGGLEFDLDGRWTADLVRHDDGKWFLAAAHYSVNMFDNPLLDNAKRFAWIAGAIAGVAGLVIGFLLASLRRRKPKAA